jgi:hypothetical protein
VRRRDRLSVAAAAPERVRAPAGSKAAISTTTTSRGRGSSGALAEEVERSAAARFTAAIPGADVMHPEGAGSGMTGDLEEAPGETIGTRLPRPCLV